MFSELCVPGFKALVNLATDCSIDLETIDLKPLERETFQEDLAKLNFNVKRGVQVEELLTMVKEDEFPSLKPSQLQPAILEVVDRFQHATVTNVLVKEAEKKPEKIIGTKSIIKAVQTGKQTMEEVILDVSKEFGPSSEPVKEIAAVGQLLQEGVKCDEVISLVESGMLPALQKPETQSCLVTMVANKGHVSTVCEVLTEDSAAELTDGKLTTEKAELKEVKEKLVKAKAETVNIKSKLFVLLLFFVINNYL